MPETSMTPTAQPRVLADEMWWKLLLVAAYALGLVIMGSGLGVKAWFLGLFLVASAGVCAARGVVLGTLRLLRRGVSARPR